METSISSKGDRIQNGKLVVGKGAATIVMILFVVIWEFGKQELKAQKLDRKTSTEYFSTK